MKRFLRPVLARVARSLGIRELQEIVARQEQFQIDVSSAIADQDTLRQELAQVERLVFRRLSDQVEMLRADLLSIHQQMDELEAEQKIIVEHGERFAVERINAAQQAVVEHAATHSESLSQQTRQYVEAQIALLRREIDLVRSSLRQSNPTAASSNNKNVRQDSSGLIDDALYVALEDHFRGSEELIRSRQESYIPLVMSSISEEFPLIDFGCGRGEWLEILHSAGLPARGYDSNVVCVEECKSRGLSVELGDLVEILDSLPDESVGAVTMFQVFEHLPFSILEGVIRSSRRVLRPGGVLVAEVPNSENLSVGASTFWIDPTHERPLHPEVLRFLARQTGFTEVSGLYTTPLRPTPEFDQPEILARTVQEIHFALFGPADFALVARV